MYVLILAGFERAKICPMAAAEQIARPFPLALVEDCRGSADPLEMNLALRPQTISFHG